MKASVVIANYNNEKYIDECINSIKDQTFKDFEIIFFDDNSKDNSVDIVSKHKDIKIIENKSQTKFGSLNQFNAFNQSIEISKGEIIFFLDSDDYFHKEKLEKIVNQFDTKKNLKILYDFPIIFENKKKINQRMKNKLLKTYWDYIHPTSCISVKRDFVQNIFNLVRDESYTDIWMDLRLHLYTKYLTNNYFVLDENLTYYRQTDENISSKFKKFSINWWKRRREAHEYFFSFAKNNKLSVKKNLDYRITKHIYNLIK